MLTTAIVLITAALILYTAGVWAEHRAGTLRTGHAVLFGLGLLADASGTWVMSQIAGTGAVSTEGAAGTLNALMAVTGALALLLMAFHLAWAVVVLVRDREQERRVFHRFSVIVWAIWLVPYFTGMLGAML